MFETEITFGNLHYSHSRLSRAPAWHLSFLTLLLAVALTTASFAGSNYDGPAKLRAVTDRTSCVSLSGRGVQSCSANVTDLPGLYVFTDTHITVMILRRV
jgi:hypothetical protein